MASPTPCFLGRPQGLGSAPWRGEGRRSPRDVGWAGGALEPVEEGQADGTGDSGVLRWVPGQLGGTCAPGEGKGGYGPVTLLGTGTRGMALVHTACGRSESKHLRPTPAGHAEGCSVIALCWPGSPRQAGRGPVSCDSGPSSLATQCWAGVLGTGLPPPHPQPHFTPRPPQRPCPTYQAQAGQEPGVLCPCCTQPFRQGVGWKWGEPQGHPALDGKSSGGQCEELSPEKIQQEREAEGSWP